MTMSGQTSIEFKGLPLRSVVVERSGYFWGLRLREDAISELVRISIGVLKALMRLSI